MVDGDEELAGLGELDDDTSDPMGSGEDATEDNTEDTDAVEDTSEESSASGPVEGEALGAVRQQRSASQRIQQEISRRKAVEVELNEYRRHVLDMQRRDAVTRPPTEDPDEERRRLEFMDEGQRIQYYVNKATSQQQTELRQLQLQMNIRDDKSGFNSYLTENPQYKKYATDVEKEFQESLRKGYPESRADILTKIIGAEVIKKGSVALNKARQTGQDNLRRQQTKPSSTRSGVTGTSRRVESAEETLKRRLAGGEYT